MLAVVNHQQRVLVSQQCDDGFEHGPLAGRLYAEHLRNRADYQRAITQCGQLNPPDTEIGTVLLLTSGDGLR